MKQTIEEAEKEYCDKNYPYSDLNIRLMVENAFEAGADWQAKQSPWISVEKRLPEVGELVLCRMGRPRVVTLPDFEFEDYGDYVCDMWTPIPSFDQILKSNKDVLQRLK